MTGHEDRPRTGTDSFTRFYNEWIKRGYGAALKLGLGPEDAKEAASDAMKAVHAAWGNIETPEAYYRHVLQCRVTDTLRKVLPQRAAEVPLHYGLSGTEAQVPTEAVTSVSSSKTPEDAVMAQENETLLARVMRQLPEPYRASLYLASQGYHAQERADIKGVLVSTERTHLQRARQQCIDLLAAIEPENKSDAVKAAEKRMREFTTKEGEEA